MEMRLQHLQPHPLLRGYVAKMWIFESKGLVPVEDMKLIVPNGMVKITIPFKNGVSAQNKEMFQLSKEGSIILIGIGDIPTKIELEEDVPSGNIGIEFSPLGAYRIFQIRQSELKNRVFLLEDVFGKSAKELREIIANTESIDGKIKVMEQYLLKRLFNSENDQILDYCINLINSSKGLVTIEKLVSKTGYSHRWIHEKFIDKVGLSPKNYSTIVRFMQFYEQWAKNPDYHLLKQNVHNFFYDQAHFIKEFNRFTGLSPLKFVKSENEFGKIFYRE
jgi:AraC-like DNA-binding protein